MIYFRRILVFVFVAGVIYLLLIHKLDLNKAISINQITSTEMSKAVYANEGKGVQISFENVELSHEDVSQIVDWINATPESAKTRLKEDRFAPSIRVGVILKFKWNNEIRIQYDCEKIYITRTGVAGRELKYSMDQHELKNFLDEHLKGTYFGKGGCEQIGVEMKRGR